LFVRAGSVVPLGSPVESTRDKQTIAHVKVYPGTDGNFDVYTDDGLTYAYEKGASQTTHLHWDDSTRKLTQSGAEDWNADAVLEVVRAQ
jgi:alpha-glucosidase (family GH31 glycosyl hydrolase)